MNLLAWLYQDAANAEAGARADEKLNESNQSIYGPGYVMVEDQIGSVPGVEPWVGPVDQEKQIETAFGEGWQDGKNNISGAVASVAKVVSDGVSSVALGIPLWVWLAGMGAIWVWLGAPGLAKLKAKLK